MLGLTNKKQKFANFGWAKMETQIRDGIGLSIFFPFLEKKEKERNCEMKTSDFFFFFFYLQLVDQRLPGEVVASSSRRKREASTLCWRLSVTAMPTTVRV